MDRNATQKAGWLTAKEYDSIYSRVTRFCVDLVIRNEKGDFLLTLRKIEPYKNTWHLQGGKVGFREPIVKAIQRIAKAELNSKVIVRKMLGHMEFLREMQNSHQRHTVSLVFQIDLVDEKIHGSWQAEKFKYFSKLPKNVHPIHRKFLRSIKKAVYV